MPLDCRIDQNQYVLSYNSHLQSDVQNKILWIITFTFLNNCNNCFTDDFCSFREGFYWGGRQKKADIFSCNIPQIKLFYGIVYEYPLNLHQCSLGWQVYLGDKLQDVKTQVWIDQIWNESLQYLFSGSSSFFIDWYWLCIFHVEFDGNLFHQTRLEM